MFPTARFQKIILGHYKSSGRDLAWRRTKDPYRILVSEIMLQQTQVARVESFYEKFIQQFPDFRTLAKAKTADVLRAWQGLGYNRRALALQKLAKTVAERHGGRLPRDRETLESLPGIGSYTAGAIRTFAFGDSDVFIETNIRRVFIHFFFPKRRKIQDTEIVPLIEQTLPAQTGLRAGAAGRDAVKRWYWALMDYGAMLGTTAARNPNRRSAHYAKQSKFSGSDRELRGKLLHLLLERKSVKNRELAGVFPESRDRIAKVAIALEREGFIIRENDSLKAA